MNDDIQLFEDQRIRTAWDEEKEEWFFSVVDVVAVLTNQKDQRGVSNYWAKLKQRLKEEGADQLLTNCQQLKLKSVKDGKTVSDRCSKYRATVAYYSVYSISESKAIQVMAGPDRAGTY